MLTILELIGNTPLVEVKRLQAGQCRLFLKLEQHNPGGSIKDRIALSMIGAAESEGRIKPGDLLVEATAGNTGLGLALVAAQKGYRLLIVVPDKMSQEKIFHLKAMGAEVVLTRSDVTKGHPEYYQDLAARLSRETPNAYYINQFGNPANPLAHEQTTGPEIWQQMDHQVDAVVAGVGTGGTITGLSRFFERVAPQTDIVLADPEGSVLANYVKTGTLSSDVGSWLVEGIGEDFIPPVCDLSRVKKAYSIPDAEAFEVCRTLLGTEGILAGTSSGTLIAAALRYCREQSAPKRVVTLVCDSGNKYLSKVYNDYWMLDQGFIQRERFGDLRDLIARRHREHAVATVNADETVLNAYQRMKLYDVSQLPVLKDGKIVGIVDEEDILLRVADNPGYFRRPVSEAMESHLVTVPPDATIEQLMDIFKRGLVAIVVDRDEFLGLITRIDLLNWLRRRATEK
jgi:cystathionine beta-synthase